MWSFYLGVFLFCFPLQRCSTSSIPSLDEDSSQSLAERMQAGKTSFIYFGNHVDPTIRLFLDQLAVSADALEDYGISVAKVNCSNTAVANYCTKEKLMTKAYLFRGLEVLKIFDIDTVFDVNAIVSHVLFALLFNEVRYVHTPAELLQVESLAKKTTDVVVGHISVLGLPEHRALMEAAFVYGSKYQFVQTSGSLILKHMGVADPSSSQSRLWFLHCKSVSERFEPCSSTVMRKHLNTINIHTFLQLMEAPLVTEATVDPSEVDVVHVHLSVPVLYLFSQPQTLSLDRASARTIALQLRGDAGVVLIHRNGPGNYNAAYRLPQDDVKYFTLTSAEEALQLFRENLLPDPKTEDEDEEDEQWADLDILDDEVSESVYRDRHLMLDLGPVSELTSDSFQTETAQNGITVVLFYFKWDAVCLAFIQSYVEVADALEGVSELRLASVDCGEWTDVCTEQNVTSFPSVLIYGPAGASRPYTGMLGTKNLQRFLLLSLISGPALLSSSADVSSFLEGDLYRKYLHLSRVRVLGLFGSAQDPGVFAFKEAASFLTGEIIVGLFAHTESEQWVKGLEVKLPALLVSRGPGAPREALPLTSVSTDMLVSLIRRAELEHLPELTVDNLPWYLELGKPLLLLFVGKDDTGSVKYLSEIRSLLSSGQLGSFLPCWIHLGRTPIGRSILENYFGFVPPLPALVMPQLESGGEVFLFPPERHLLAQNILRWIQAVESGQEQSAGLIPADQWDSPLPFHDFLAIMDREAPGYAAQRPAKTRNEKKRSSTDDEGESEEKNVAHNQRQTPNPPAHSEL